MQDPLHDPPRSEEQSSQHPNPDQTIASNTNAQHEEKGVFSRRNLLKGAVATGALTAAGAGGFAVFEAVKPDQALAAGSNVETARGGKLREYWIQADSFFHNIVPTGLDGMMGTKYKASETSFWAIAYRAYSPGWKQLLPGNDNLGPNQGMPGPNIRAEVGDTIRIHFRNNDAHYKFPHSIHPHGVFYTPESDGAWVFLEPKKPGTAIPFGGTYTYEWKALPSSVGTWVYHDHTMPFAIKGDPIMELGAELGLFGFIVVTDNHTPRVDKEIFVFFQDLFAADIPDLPVDYDLFNGFAFLGNTPTYRAKVGQKVRWHVAALGNEFHVFHLHGHRWMFNGRFDDSLVFGPSTTLTFDYVEDNPGKWLYHCHVTEHMQGGMVGYYIVEDD